MGLKQHAFVAVFSFLSVTGSCWGQSSESGSGQHSKRHVQFHHGHHGYGGHFYRPGFRFGGYGFGAHGYYRPFGPNGFEIADVIRAQSEANLVNANARTQNAVAYQLELENKLQTIATRLERRRINTETRFGHLHAKAEWRREQAALAKAAPSPHVDPVTGAVAWPLILSTTHYAQARAPINAVFAERAQRGAINPDIYQPMRDWIEKIQCELKTCSAHYEMNDYLDAQAFLRHLIDEARRPAASHQGGQALASVQ